MCRTFLNTHRNLRCKLYANYLKSLTKLTPNVSAFYTSIRKGTRFSSENGLEVLLKFGKENYDTIGIVRQPLLMDATVSTSLLPFEQNTTARPRQLPPAAHQLRRQPQQCHSHVGGLNR